MTIRRVVPDIASTDIAASVAFYVDVLGFELSMDLGWIATVSSPSNPTAEISFMTHDESAPVRPEVTVEVADVDAAYERAIARGVEVVHNLRDEPWGVRRFFLRDPNGRVINVMSHRVGAPPGSAKQDRSSPD